MKTLAFIFLLFATPVAALDLSIPRASEVRSETTPAGRIRLPEAPWSPDASPAVVEGEITRRVLRVPSSSRTSLQLVQELRTTLEQAGYEEVFGCADAACGGFDFRFQLDILGEPDMHVDLGDFVYLLMRAPDATTQPHSVAVLASRSQVAGFVHITTVSEPGPLPEPDLAASDPETTVPEMPEPDDFISSLTQGGHAVLAGLDFGSGTSDLGDGPYPSLQALANWLGANPSARIVLVGHTDSIGSLEANTALSRQRAASVASFLVRELNADNAQIQSSGAGFLAPVASNLTEAGRAANRRVEVVLLSLEE